MNKIKDFFYNKNDIIIVLIILIAAAFIIYTRIDAIMAYPEQLAEKAAQQETEAKEESTSDSSQSSDASSASGTSTPVSITITDSDTSATVAAKLYEAGLITSDTEFTEYVSSQGKESSLKSGTFQINMGSSNEDILNIITN